MIMIAEKRQRRAPPQTLPGVKWLWYEEVVKVHELMRLGKTNRRFAKLYSWEPKGAPPY